MSHIAVERNRRRQMNEHLKVLRSLTPPFYIKRGDQASIIGGAVEFIKELHLVLQSLESKKHRMMMNSHSHLSPCSLSPTCTAKTPSPTETQQQSPFQLITTAGAGSLSDAASSSSPSSSGQHMFGACCSSSVADVEAKISGSNVLLKTLSKRIPGQVAKIIAVLESFDFEVLHLNISSTCLDDTVLYSFVVKIGFECQLSVEELALEVQKSFCCQDAVY